MDEVSTTLGRVRGRVTSRDGTAIAYERYGDGRHEGRAPVVLVSGALATAAAERPLAGLLARHFTVFAYDRRGRGGSGDAGPCAVEREIEDLAAVVEAAGAGAALHGTGTGGALALAAVAAGLPAAALSVYEPPYSAEAAEVWRRVAALLEEGRPEAALGLVPADTSLPAEVWLAGAEPARALAHDLAVLGDGPPPGRALAEVHARVLVVDGGFSPAGTRRAARGLAAALPRGRHRTLTGQTSEVAPHVLAPVLEEFLTEEREDGRDDGRRRETAA
ncbi:alpha/beta fold hydrolase [Streptomyces sp. NPDC048330]|uniref:alpha/beta fold hydrolase n=1 Tax=Streptomyces sp. NPDC048330 TaxID=3365533 RepID=UPI003717921A